MSVSASAPARVPALALREVAAAYGPGVGGSLSAAPASGTEILRDITLTVRPGELLCVLGPNGAGKSTLLRVMSGDLRPTRGSVLLFGEPLLDPRGPFGDRRAVARAVAVVGQSSHVAMGFRVRDVVLMGRAPHQGGWMRASSEDDAVADESLRRCDLARLADRPVDALSGGEQKRVAIARALAQRARLLLLDEPAAFLDVRHQVDLYELLADEVARNEVACVCVTHDFTLAAQYASRVALIKEGHLVAEGRVDEVMTYKRLSETFDVDLYAGVNDLSGVRFFLPMRGRPRPSASG
jgi:iron complex transport system ATP-binding protein